MNNRINFKKVLSTTIAVMMAAMICFVAIPSYHTQAATKKVKVTLSQEGGEKDVEMNAGQKLQIKVKKDGKTLSKKSVTYKSSKKSVASVSKSGVITAKKGGDCEISIKDKNSDFTATIYVEVKKKGQGSGKKTTKLWLSQASVNLKVGQTFNCKVFSDPDGSATVENVKWSSDDDSIATVSGGVIKAQNPGQVGIHANKDGKDACIMVYVSQ
jgi:hypothetical protein